MNKYNRQRISKMMLQIQTATPDLEGALSLLEELLEIEETSRDNMEEYFSESPRFETISNNCDALDEAIGCIDVDDPDCIADVLQALEQIDGI